MLLIHVYAIGALAVLFTFAWLFRPDERTAATTFGAFLTWGLVALLGGQTQTYVDAGAELIESQTGNEDYHSVALGEELVAAPIPDEIRLFALLCALLSIVTTVLYQKGAYPPDSEEPIDKQMSQR